MKITTKTAEHARDLLVTLWLALVVIGFWGPYFAVLLPLNVAHALYAGFVVVVVATLALRFLRRQVD